MCRVFFIGGYGGLPVGRDGYNVAINYLLNAAPSNRDGYCLGSSGLNGRHMKIEDNLAWAEQSKLKLQQASYLVGHARASTNQVCNDFIHGWKIKDEFGTVWWCAHNGIVYPKKASSKNDSLSLFQSILTRKGSMIKRIKAGIANDISGGWGVIVMASETRKYIACFNKDANIHLINDSLLVVNSQDDIHKFRNSYTTENKSKTKVFGLEFSSNEEKSIDISVNIVKDLKCSVNNLVLVIDEKNNIVSRVPLNKVPHSGYGGVKTYTKEDKTSGATQYAGYGWNDWSYSSEKSYKAGGEDSD